MKDLEEQLVLKEIFASMQKFTTLDDEGFISVVLFTRGCNFRCHYCHNPELVVPPFSSFLDVNEVKNFLENRVGILNSVVITGGEPTLWGEDLRSWIVFIKSLGYRVKLDSNGTNPNLLQKLIDEKLIDKVAMDIKAPSKTYETVINAKVDYSLIEKSISLLLCSDLEVDFRTTIHSDLHSLSDIVDMFTELKEYGVKELSLQFFKSRNKLVGNLGEDSLKDFSAYLEELLKNNFQAYKIRNLG